MYAHTSFVQIDYAQNFDRPSYIQTFLFTDKDNLHQIILDVVARRRAKCTAENQHSDSDEAKSINDMIDASLMLKLPEETMIGDLLTFFIAGFHTTASRK